MCNNLPSLVVRFHEPNLAFQSMNQDSSNCPNIMGLPILQIFSNVSHLRIFNFCSNFSKFSKFQGSSNSAQNGHESTELRVGNKEMVDIKDVELTLLPSYLQEQESVNVIDNTDLLQSISKPNPQLSPPKRPPRTNQSPEGKILPRGGARSA